MNAEIIKQAAEKEIACHPDQKNIRFKIDDTIFWIKRKYSNKRNRLVKQPPETEFLFEVARIAIAAKACPGLFRKSKFSHPNTWSPVTAAPR